MTTRNKIQSQGRGLTAVLSRLSAFVAVLLLSGFAAAQTNPFTPVANPRTPTGSSSSSSSSSNSRINPSQNRTTGTNSNSKTSGTNTTKDKSKLDRSSRRSKDKDKDKTPAKGNESGRALVQGASGTAAQLRAKNKKDGGAAKGGGGNTKQALPLPVIQINPLITQTTLYFSPAQDRHAADSRFTTHLFLYNAETQPVDRLDIWLHFPTDLIEPREVDFSPVREQIDGEPLREVLREGGYIHLAVRFNSPVNRLIQPLLNVNWQALGLAASVPLMIESPNGEPVGIYVGSKNLLDASKVGNDGLVAGELNLIGPDGSAGDDEAFQEIAEGVDPTQPGLKAGAGVRLGLVPKSDEVLPGELSTIDVVLINPHVADFDELRFRLRFDPAAIEILDADENNFITTGVNIYDGGFHKGMPFDLHTKNEVNQAAGTIDYVAGAQSGPRGFASGTIARIVYRMRRDAGAATVWFEGLDPLTGHMVSDVRSRGRSLLGDEEVRPGEALHNTQVAVAPLK